MILKENSEVTTFLAAGQTPPLPPYVRDPCSAVLNSPNLVDVEPRLRSGLALRPDNLPVMDIVIINFRMATGLTCAYAQVS
ncbi:hypothetical protein CVT25_000071 [Psilocybe cyanescens]|uniref:Uncharacterized protein n=1 Tax=Psilocybe cyanescens TaxID=93625 RepID=A0A409XEG0_PSICY|nr:hypothetical protein CVT25_000071 [Psilocybe cyanescens]